MFGTKQSMSLSQKTRKPNMITKNFNKIDYKMMTQLITSKIYHIKKMLTAINVSIYFNKNVNDQK